MLLGLHPKVLRSLLDEYLDFLVPLTPEDCPMGHMSSASYSLLGLIVDRRNAGQSPEEIRAALVQMGLPSPDWDGPDEGIADMVLPDVADDEEPGEETGLAAAVAAADGEVAAGEAEGGSTVLAVPGPDGPESLDLDDRVAVRRKVGDLIAEVAKLKERLARTEEQHMQDRDRLTTALYRTEQELAVVRAQLAGGKHRRDRKKSWWAKLWDF